MTPKLLKRRKNKIVLRSLQVYITKNDNIHISEAKLKNKRDKRAPMITKSRVPYKKNIFFLFKGKLQFSIQ